MRRDKGVSCVTVKAEIHIGMEQLQFRWVVRPQNEIRSPRRMAAPSMDFRNTTSVADSTLLPLIEEAIAPWNVGRIRVRVRYSRGADFSGTCFYRDRRIHVNLGRHLTFPYRLGTNLGRVRSFATHWQRPIYQLVLNAPYQLVYFIFLHELFHLLVETAKRNTRQKEAMCDRFAARALVDGHGVVVTTKEGMLVPRDAWDFQDLERFVAAARIPAAAIPAPRRALQIARARG